MAFVIPLVPYIMAAAAVVGTYAAVKQGQAASSEAKYNQQLAQQNADAARAQGDAAAAQQHREMGLKLGALAANTGASGVDGSSGSALDVLSSSITQGTLDNMSTKYNYQLKALGYSNSATLDSASASNATTASYLSAAGSALGGAASTGKAAYAQGGFNATPGGG